MKKIFLSIVLIACISGLSLTSFRKDSMPDRKSILTTNEVNKVTTRLANEQTSCTFYRNTFTTTTGGTSVFEAKMGVYPDCLFDWPVIRIQKSIKPGLSSVNVYVNGIQWISNKYFSKDQAFRFINIPYGTETFIKVELTGKAGAWIDLSIVSGPKDEYPCPCLP